MGTLLQLVIANLFMINFEEQSIETTTDKPKLQLNEKNLNFVLRYRTIFTQK